MLLTSLEGTLVSKNIEKAYKLVASLQRGKNSRMFNLLRSLQHLTSLSGLVKIMASWSLVHTLLIVTSSLA
jgi:hypothetical protein